MTKIKPKQILIKITNTLTQYLTKIQTLIQSLIIISNNENKLSSKYLKIEVNKNQMLIIVL